MITGWRTQWTLLRCGQEFSGMFQDLQDLPRSSGPRTTSQDLLGTFLDLRDLPRFSKPWRTFKDLPQALQDFLENLLRPSRNLPRSFRNLPRIPRIFDDLLGTLRECSRTIYEIFRTFRTFQDIILIFLDVQTVFFVLRASSCSSYSMSYFLFTVF